MDPLHFRENKSKGKDAIVFLHGGGITGLGWQTTLQTIPEYYCLAPDLPGSGRSAHITPLTLENAVEGQADPHGNSTPTVVLVGEKELGVNKKRARAIVNALENGKGYLVPGLGHSWPLQKPALFRRADRAWMSNDELGQGFVPLPM